MIERRRIRHQHRAAISTSDTAPAISIYQALVDGNLLGASLGEPATWETWLTCLKAAFGVELNRQERRAFEAIAGSRKPPNQRVQELWAIVGRGGGKSRVAAAIAVYVACFLTHKLDPGEIGHVLVLAAGQRQASIVFSYCAAFIRKSAILRKMHRSMTAHEIRLTNNVVIAVHSASFRTIRGRTLLAVVCDEVAFWRSEESAIPDIEVYRAVRPSLARTNGMLIGISTPYRRSGLLHQKYKDFFGENDPDVLVVKGATTDFNPTISQKVVAKAIADDPQAARSEWEAEFRSDVSGLFDDQVIADAVDHGRPLELPPRPDIKYFAFTDASAGRNDAFALCVGHADGKKDEQVWTGDVIRGVVAPFNPRAVAEEFAALCRHYGISKITGDAFAGEWVSQAFRDCGIAYETSPLPKSQLYLEALPHFNRGAVRLPEYEPLLRELRQLERRVHRSGRDSVDHPKHGSDDLANVVCGALYLAAVKARRGFMRVGFGANILPKIRYLGEKEGHTAFDYVHINGWTGETIKKQTRLLPRATPSRVSMRVSKLGRS